MSNSGGNIDPQRPSPLPDDSGGSMDAGPAEVRDQVRPPRVDWLRTAISTAALTVFVGGTAYALVAQPEATEIALATGTWVTTSVLGLLILGFWLGRTSRSSSFLGSVIMGAGIGGGTALILDTLEFSLEGTVLFTIL